MSAYYEHYLLALIIFAFSPFIRNVSMLFNWRMCYIPKTIHHPPTLTRLTTVTLIRFWCLKSRPNCQTTHQRRMESNGQGCERQDFQCRLNSDTFLEDLDTAQAQNGAMFSPLDLAKTRIDVAFCHPIQPRLKSPPRTHIHKINALTQCRLQWCCQKSIDSIPTQRLLPKTNRFRCHSKCGTKNI